MIATGKKPITFMSFCAIMSISLVVNLPGLAITPMLGTLHSIFPDTTQIEDQLLTVLPNLLIIPFVLLSGKLSLAHHKVGIIVTSLVIFFVCSVGYMLAEKMWQLIVISCLLGCGTGLLVPFSTGLIANFFCGDRRMKMMGLQSGISNTAVMTATFAVSWLCGRSDWHLPFSVYLIGIVPLILTPWLRRLPADELNPPTSSAADCSGDTISGPNAYSMTQSDENTVADSGPKVRDGFYIGRLIGLVGVYFFITFATISISYYCPYLVEKEGWSDSVTGTSTALYFLFILMPGYVLGWFVKHLGNYCFLFSAICMSVGMGIIAFVPHTWSLCAGASLAGLGYGICQPLIYDKASLTVKSGNRATMALAIVLTANYLAIVLTPFIIDFVRNLLHAEYVTGFAFIMSFTLLVLFTLLTGLRRRSFVFSSCL